MVLEDGLIVVLPNHGESDGEGSADEGWDSEDAIEELNGEGHEVDLYDE